MTGEEAATAVSDALTALGIPFMLVGSFSSNFYGLGRSTKDADFVIELGGRSVNELARQLGPGFRLDPQMTFETVTMTTKHEVTVADSDFQIELFHLTDDPHDQERFRRRKPAKLAGHDVFIPTVEDVIVMKLKWSQRGLRSKDRDDVKDVIAVQGDAIDWPYVYSWCDRHGTRELLDEIRRSIPPI